MTETYLTKILIEMIAVVMRYNLQGIEIRRHLQTKNRQGINKTPLKRGIAAVPLLSGVLLIKISSETFH